MFAKEIDLTKVIQEVHSKALAKALLEPSVDESSIGHIY